MGRRHAAVLDEVRVRDGHVVDAASKEPFDLLFSPPKFEYGDVVGREGFEPSKAVPTDLQSAPFGHLGTDPRPDTIPDATVLAQDQSRDDPSCPVEASEQLVPI